MKYFNGLGKDLFDDIQFLSFVVGRLISWILKLLVDYYSESVNVLIDKTQTI